MDIIQEFSYMAAIEQFDAFDCELEVATESAIVDKLKGFGASIVKALKAMLEKLINVFKKIGAMLHRKAGTDTVISVGDGAKAALVRVLDLANDLAGLISFCITPQVTYGKSISRVLSGDFDIDSMKNDYDNIENQVKHAIDNMNDAVAEFNKASEGEGKDTISINAIDAKIRKIIERLNKAKAAVESSMASSEKKAAAISSGEASAEAANLTREFMAQSRRGYNMAMNMYQVAFKAMTNTWAKLS